MPTALFERNWRRKDYSRDLRRRIIVSRIKKILGIQALTFTEETLLNQTAICLLEIDRIEKEYAEGKALDKNYLPLLSRLQSLYSQLGLTKKHNKPKENDSEFDFDSIINDDT